MSLLALLARAVAESADARDLVNAITEVPQLCTGMLKSPGGVDDVARKRP